MALHKDLALANLHSIHAYSYADETARNAASGFVAGDIGKACRQEDTGEFYILTATTPTWQHITINDSEIDHNSLINTHNLTTDIDHDQLTNTHNLSTDIDHDGLTNTHNLTTDIDHDSLTNTHDLTTDIDHDTITNNHNLTTDIDHDQLTNTHDLTTDIDHNTITNNHNLTTDIDHDQLTNTHNLSTDIDHDGLTNTHDLTTDIDHSTITNGHNLTTDIDHNTINNNHNLTTDIDHDQLTNAHNLSTDIDHDGLTNTHNLTTDITHNNVSGLQGGTSGEYYHLTSAQVTQIGTNADDIDTLEVGLGTAFGSIDSNADNIGQNALDIADLPAYYLKKDASNDPVTGALEIAVTNAAAFKVGTGSSDVLTVDTTNEKVIIEGTDTEALNVSDGTNDVLTVDTTNKKVTVGGSNAQIGTDAKEDLITLTNDDITVDGDVIADSFSVSALNAAPSSASDTGTAGEVRITASYIYVCTATDTWKRAALSTW